MKRLLLAIGASLSLGSPALAYPRYDHNVTDRSGYMFNKIITGKVTNEAGEELGGVTVTVKGSRVSAVSATDGTFRIDVPDNATTLVFTFVGMESREMSIAGKTNIFVVLKAVENSMQDVVVVGYGTKKKANVLGAVASIKGAEIEDIPVASMSQALVNRLPGVGVNFASGKPGSTTSINIRGSQTFGGASLYGVTSDPLFVIDGIVVTKEDFDNLDASMVESINFLKDASAAIYGAAGAKGVVLVSTKRGKAGKPKITYSGYFGSSTAAVKPDVMSAYEHAKMLNDGYELNNAALNQRFSKADLDFLATNPYRSWYDQLWKPSNNFRHTVNVSGGSDRVTFFAGGNYFSQDGNYGGISLMKYGFRAGMDAKITTGLTANVSFASDFSRDERRTLKGASDETDDLNTRAIILTPQWVPLVQNGLPVNWSGPNPPGAWNPVALENSGNYKWNKSQGLSVNAALEYKPTFIKGLTARFQYGKLNRNGSAKEYFPAYRVNTFARRGQNNLLFTDSVIATPLVSNSDQLGQSSGTSGSYQFIASLAYGRKIGKTQDFDVFVAMDQSAGNNENIYFYKNGQLVQGVDQFWAFNNNGQTIRNPSFDQNVKRSFLGRLNYSLLDRYVLEVITRYDASAKFPESGRWGLFPTVGLGWKVSEERFMRNLTFINFLKLRANYGMVGEDRLQALTWKDRLTQTTGALFGSTPTNGLDPNIYANPDITWEKSRTLNIGMDATIFRKFTLGIELYQRYTYDGYDKLDNGALPWTAGMNTALVNYGTALSWGSEFTVGYRTSINRDWGVSADANFGWSRSQLQQAFFNAANLGTYGPNQLAITVGRDPRRYTSTNYGYISKGILRTQQEVDAVLAKNPNYRIGGQRPQVGFMDFVDIDGDGQINDNDITTMFDRINPDVSFGITLGVSYKSFRLNTNLNLRVGGKAFYDAEARKVPTTTQNAPSFWKDSWTPDNPNAQFPRADAPLARELSTFWAVEGTQSRFNNMVLSWSMPKTISERYRIPEMRAFLTGTNLWSLKNPLKYKDPYTSNFASYPTLRTISLGVNVSM